VRGHEQDEVRFSHLNTLVKLILLECW